MNGKRDWMKCLTLVLCAALLGLNLWLLRQISDLRAQLSNVNGNVKVWTEDIKTYVASRFSQMESAEKMVQDWDYTVSLNKERQGLDAAVTVTLREWGEDTVVELLWTNARDGGHGSASMSGRGAGRFAGTLELPLEGDQEYMLEAVIRSGGTERREDLGYLGDTLELLPVQCYGWGLSGPDYIRDNEQDGTLSVKNCEVELRGDGKTPPQLSDQMFRLRRNGEIAAEKTAMFGNTIDQYTCEELSAKARIGDEFILSFFCRDASGLGYEFFLDGWTIGEGGLGEHLAPGVDWPKLTWD